MQDNDSIFGYVTSGLGPFMRLSDSQLRAGIAQAADERTTQGDQDAADMRGVLNLRAARDYRRVTGRQAVR
jgi:hypothetical protein